MKVVYAPFVLLKVVAYASTAYLFLVTLVALMAPKKTAVGASAPTKRIAFLVPAHNEEKLIARAVDSLRRVDYPPGLFDIHVVADNCTDATAAIAGRGGASVMERQDATAVSKGAALSWAVGRLLENGSYDAVAVIDADSEVSPNFLKVMNDGLERGAQALQAYHTIGNTDSNWLTTMTHVSFAIQNYVKPLAASALGLSCGIVGNGMCFSTGLLRRFGWTAFSLTEDAEYHVHLVEQGFKVEFAPAAVVYADAAAALATAHSQRMRWEKGKFALARQHGIRILIAGIKHGNLSLINTAADLLVPPFSLIILMLAAIAIVPVAVPGLAAAFSPLAWVTAVTALAVPVFVGLARAGISGQGYVLFFIYLPVFIVWKAWVLALTAVEQSNRWVRTQR